MILVSSPPASGKTYISKMLAKNLKHVVYLDKDTTVPLSDVVFEVAHEKKDRNGPFFEKYLRDVEYEVVLQFGYEALEYDDIVLINAPFTKEIRQPQYLNAIKDELKKRNARLIIIWVDTDPEVIHARMIERNSPRDKYKLENWEKYNSTVDYSIPTNLDDPKIKDDLLVFYNSNEDQFNESMTRILSILEEE